MVRLAFDLPNTIRLVMKRDLRKYTKQTYTRLIIGGLLILFVLGDFLIYIVYGAASAVSGLICMGLGMIPLVLIYLFFILLDWIVKHNEES
jgi:hypothetical protein